MCMFSAPKAPPAPELPPERAAQRAPDNAATAPAGRRMGDRMRAATPTILTGPQGAMSSAPTEKKTLLGQ